MRLSLALKWSLTLLLSSLTGVILVGLFAYRTTVNEFDRLRSEQAQESFQSQVVDYYQTYKTWDGLDRWLRNQNSPDDKHHNPPPQQMFTVLDNNGTIVSGNGPFRKGERPSGAQVGQGIPIIVNNERVGTLLVSSPLPELDPREQLYLDRTNQALLIGALGASGIALLVGILLSRQFLRPLTELRQAIAAMKQGNLNQQVEVRTQDELGELARTFNQMSEQVHTANLLRQQMTANIAHDLRTPLLVINGYLEALCDGTLQATPERFEVMRRESTLLNRLIGDLRTLSLADAGELKLQAQAINLSDLLHQVKQSFEPIAAQQQVSLVVQAGETLPPIQLDRERMIQVLSNLVSNALRYTPQGGSIILSARQKDIAVQLVVQDTGIGIPTDKLPYIFERLYRIEESRSQQDGESGLGLAIAKSIVESHGGIISALSTTGTGTTITIQLPLNTV